MKYFYSLVLIFVIACETEIELITDEVNTTPAIYAVINPFDSFPSVRVQRSFIIREKGDIKFQSPDTLYNVTWTKDWQDPQPTLSETIGVDQTTRHFFKLGVLVNLFIGSDYQNIAEELLPVDLSGQVTIDIHKFFAERLFSEFTFPESSDNLLVLQENSCRPCRIRAKTLEGSGSIMKGIANILIVLA